jgi:heme-degrading monooxygenase HmoA
MSVLMTMHVIGDPKAVEEADQEVLDVLIERAKEHGLISHHFFGRGNEVLVVDEWPDEESFQAFADESPEIAEMMAMAGATSPPTVEFWRPLDVGDAVGW